MVCMRESCMKKEPPGSVRSFRHCFTPCVLRPFPKVSAVTYNLKDQQISVFWQIFHSWGKDSSEKSFILVSFWHKSQFYPKRPSYQSSNTTKRVLNPGTSIRLWALPASTQPAEEKAITWFLLILTSFPVLMQPLISDMTPLVSILNRIIRVLGSNTSDSTQKSQHNCCLCREQHAVLQPTLSNVLEEPQPQTLLKDSARIHSEAYHDSRTILHFLATWWLQAKHTSLS